MLKPSSIGLVAVLLGSFVSVTSSDAGLGADARCRVALYKAAAKYAACQETALARDVNPSTLVIGGMSDSYQRLAARCRAKYAATWPHLQAMLPGASRCTGPRLNDNGDGTVTDMLTGLVWESKTDDGGIHDKDDVYTWSASTSANDGTVFTAFLASLNSGACFAGSCNWRLPTMAELQTILEPVVPCTTCMDPALGPYAPMFTGTASDDPDFYDLVRAVSFAAGVLNNSTKATVSAARAVRRGF